MSSIEATGEVGEPDAPIIGRLTRNQTELVLTLFLAVAAVGTAWAGFQSAKWSGIQSIAFADAPVARAESTKKVAEA